MAVKRTGVADKHCTPLFFSLSFFHKQTEVFINRNLNEGRIKGDS